MCPVVSSLDLEMQLQNLILVGSLAAGAVAEGFKRQVATNGTGSACAQISSRASRTLAASPSGGFRVSCVFCVVNAGASMLTCMVLQLPRLWMVSLL